MRGEHSHEAPHIDRLGQRLGHDRLPARLAAVAATGARGTSGHVVEPDLAPEVAFRLRGLLAPDADLDQGGVGGHSKAGFQDDPVGRGTADVARLGQPLVVERATSSLMPERVLKSSALALARREVLAAGLHGHGLHDAREVEGRIAVERQPE
mgnify:CR=1 FL=1